MKRRAREGVLCNATAALEIDQSNRINEYGSADSRIVLRLRVAASYKWVYRIMKCPLFGLILFFMHALIVPLRFRASEHARVVDDLIYTSGNLNKPLVFIHA